MTPEGVTFCSTFRFIFRSGFRSTFRLDRNTLRLPNLLEIHTIRQAQHRPTMGQITKLPGTPVGEPEGQGITADACAETSCLWLTQGL
jgi:hypothetical protein